MSIDPPIVECKLSALLAKFNSQKKYLVWSSLSSFNLHKFIGICFPIVHKSQK